MNAQSLRYQIVFPEDYGGQWEEECSFKGWLSGVIVEFEDARTYSLTFVDVHRMTQMMEEQVASGAPYYAEPGLVVVADVTRGVIEAAVSGLVRERFFESLTPWEQEKDATA